jgi:hypothetical protein
MVAALTDSLAEWSALRLECAELFARLENLCERNPAGEYPDTFRLIAIPMMYAIWERAFTLTHAIALRLLIGSRNTNADLSVAQRSLLLQRQGFYRSYVDKLRAPEQVASRRTPAKGSFGALSDFVEALSVWQAEGIDQTIDTEELVMTFSNVNPSVVEFNADVIGLSAHSDYRRLDLARLDELVSRRNDIGHGAQVKAPGTKEFDELFVYTRTLATSYVAAAEAWASEVFATSTGAVVGVPQE